MSTNISLILSDDLNTAIDNIVSKTGDNKGEVIRKALEIYITAQDAKDKGLVLGLVDPATRLMKTEFIGL